MTHQLEQNDAIVVALTGQKELSTDLQPSKTYINGKLVPQQEQEVLNKEDRQELANQYLHDASNDLRREFVFAQGKTLLKQRETVTENSLKVDEGVISQEELDNSKTSLDKSQELLNKYLDAHILQEHMEVSESGKNLSSQEIRNRVAHAIIENVVPDYSNDMRNGAFREITSSLEVNKPSLER